MIHELKLQKQFAQSVLDGTKSFEIRENDRGFQKGDIIEFIVMDGPFNDISHPLNKQEYEITYVLSGWGLKEGYVALGIKRRR